MKSVLRPLSDVPARLGGLSLVASSVGSTARSRLRGGVEGSVIGVYDRAINMALPQGLVCLVAEAVERGPLNITVRLPPRILSMSSLGLRIGDSVMVTDKNLEIGSRLGVSFGSANVFSPERMLKSDYLEDGEVASNIEVMRKTALEHGNMRGLGELLAMIQPGAQSRKLNIFAETALPSIVKLERAFVTSDARMMTEAVHGLIGLGPGLTPSSDDMLAGLTLMCSLCQDPIERVLHASRVLCDIVVAEARGRTTILSEEYLTQAAMGRGNEPALRLCEALLGRGRESVERETQRVTAIGETSGTDTILGVVLGAILCTGRRSGLTGRENPW